MDLDPADGIAMRLYESSGRPTQATIRTRWPIVSAARTDLLEQDAQPMPVSGSTHRGAARAVRDRHHRGHGRGHADAESGAVGLAPRGEAAQPVYADYWLHNKGAAPMGYQSVTVQIKPSFASGEGPFVVPVVVASERTDGPTAGSVELIVPPGWEATPSERIYRLAPGAHLAFEASVRPPAGRPRPLLRGRPDHGRGGQTHEDVVTVDYLRAATGRPRSRSTASARPPSAGPSNGR